MSPILEATKLTVADKIRRETERAVSRFGRYSEAELRRLLNLHIDARRRITAQIVEKWGIWVKEPTGPLAISRLRDLSTAIELEIEQLSRQLGEAIPTMVDGAGNLGIGAGQKELAVLLKEFPDLIPSFTVMNKAAIDVYANYALQLSQQYSAEVLRQIQSALQLGLIEQQTIGQLTTKIRQYLGAEFRRPAKGITYKAQRIARTEMSRAYSAGHSAMGKSTDFCTGEVWHVNPMGKWPCSECEGLEGTEYDYEKGPEMPMLPKHPLCRCFTSYLYRKELFSEDELKQLKGLVKS